MINSSKRRPELIIGLVGPIGCDIEEVKKAIETSLKQVNYTSHFITLSQTIVSLLRRKIGTDTNPATLGEKILAGNMVRAAYKNNSVLAAAAIFQIRRIRARLNETKRVTLDGLRSDQLPVPDTAYIIRQLKRPEEVRLLEATYGKQFIQISITQEKSQQIEALKARIRKEQPNLSPDEWVPKALSLIKEDQHQENEEYGQRLTKIFHLGDVFIDSSNKKTTHDMTTRFINALFGKTDIGPSRDEFGSYMAKAASLRSVDLARQVGAAIFSEKGEIITLGCNETPKPGGGNYWDEDKDKARDIDIGSEANREEVSRIIFDFLDVLYRNRLFKRKLTPKDILENQNIMGDIDESLIRQITEYGRMVHAEMNAIADAARLGKSVEGATLYVTTFPCHNCAKHIIASGISWVVFIEPYPKSRTDFLYGHAVTDDHKESEKVNLNHFSGISPKRYRDIFEKGSRRSAQTGEILDWCQDKCSPRVGVVPADYISKEEHAISENLS